MQKRTRCHKCELIIADDEATQLYWLRQNITILCEDCFEEYEISPDSTTKLIDFLRMDRNEWSNRNKNLIDVN